MRRLASILALLACLFWPGQAKAITEPAVYVQSGTCNTGSFTTCQIAVSASQRVFIGGIVASDITLITSTTPSLTWHKINDDKNTFGAGSGANYYLWEWYADTGASSGTMTITYAPAAFVSSITAWNCTYIDCTSTPPDIHGFSQGTMTTGSCPDGAGFYCYTAASVTTTQANDLIISNQMQQDGTFFGTAVAGTLTGGFAMNQASNAAGINFFTGYSIVCVSSCGTANVYSPENIGAAGAYAVLAQTNGNGGSFNGMAMQTFGIKTVSSAPAAQPAPYIINYHPPAKFTPLLLYTILRNWIKEAYEGRV